MEYALKRSFQAEIPMPHSRKELESTESIGDSAFSSCQPTGSAMNTITIELVAVNGRLIGKTASCRWNLAMLGLDNLIDDGRSQASIKRARRVITREWGGAFILTKSRAKSVCLPTSRETESLGFAVGLAA